MPAGRLVVEVSCPIEKGLAVGELFRMRLRAKRPGWPQAWGRDQIPPELPRRYAMKVERLGK